MPTSFVSLVWSTTQKSIVLYCLDILNCLMGHLKTQKLEMYFIQLSSSHGYKYILIMIWMLSHWTEAFSCRQAISSSVAEVFFLGKITLTCRMPLKLYSDWGNHFNSQAFQQACAVWLVLQFHCASPSVFSSSWTQMALLWTNWKNL